MASVIGPTAIAANLRRVDGIETRRTVSYAGSIVKIVVGRTGSAID